MSDVSPHRFLAESNRAIGKSWYMNILVGWFDLSLDASVLSSNRFFSSGVRRLIIVEAGSKRVEGIVSLSDVFRFLLG